MMRAVSGFATDAYASTAGDAGYGCSDNIAPKKSDKTPQIQKRYKNKPKHLATQIVAQTRQNGALGASFGHPYHKN